MSIGLFPPKRRVIIEKFKKVKSSKKGLFRIEFIDLKYPEKFVVDSVSEIRTSITYVRAGNNETPVRTEWSPISFKIIECEGPGNGERLSAWVNSHMFNEYYSNVRASSIKFGKIYDDGSEDYKTGWWMLYGCLPTSITEENGSISLEFQINHGVLHI